MKKILLTTILIILSVLCFGQDPQSIAMSNYFFVSSGNWNDGSHWNTGEVPPEGSDVFIAADAVIPAGYTAIANQISLLGGSITVADGGQLKHNTQGLVVTMEKSIAAFNEVNSWSNYYLLAFPFSEDVAVPSTMTANEDNDFYTFDSNYPNAEWRNNKQHVIATVGGTTGYLYANPEAIELSLTGSTYQSYDEASNTVEVTYSEGLNNTFNGWALLGNPYTCNAYIYALENGSCVPKEFMVYDADGELVRCFCSSVAPMQGFFVKVDETTTICIKTTSPYVDLGLPSGTLWAACNVGAVTPEDYGDYFAWGETQPKDFYDWSTYQYCNGSYNTLTKYCSDASFGYNGFSDTLSILLRENDAATANWGSDWRMPTNEEWQELYNNTTHVWTTQNGVNGRLFTSENGNSLFLPAGGIYSNGSLGSTGSGSYYWSSSLSFESPNLSWQCSFYSNGCSSYEFARFFGLSVRPVRSGIQSTSYIIDATANPTEGGEVSGSGSFIEGTECTLTATANEGYTFTNWTENDEVVSTEAVYIFTVDSDRTLVANFTYNGGGNDHEYVDLGLPSGTLWATCNVGANAPEEYGDYFAWGETQPKDYYDWSTYQYNNGGFYDAYGFHPYLTKYCNNSDYGYNGYTDSLTILLIEDDVASANWGSDWHMPTKEEFQELYNNTTVTWTTQNGVNGGLFTANNGNSLFLPAGGFRTSSGLNSAGRGGYYWSSSLYTDSPRFAVFFGVHEDGSYGTGHNNGGRNCGRPVRTVRSAQSGTTDCTITLTPSPTEGGTVTGGGIYQLGQTCTITATANTGYTFVNWTENGIVVSNDFSYSFIVSENRALVANFTYNSGSNHEYVDLGLPSATLWATCNIGANSPEEYGDYFAWGETQPKEIYDWSTYQYSNGGDWDNPNLTKYCTNSSYGYNGFTDNLTTLLPEDDAATVNWGADWRMPSPEECEELYENTSHTWTTLNGVNGRLFTGPNGNSLFLPAAGSCFYTTYNSVGIDGYCWTNSLYADDPMGAWYFYFFSGNCSVNGGGYRENGIPVRAVRSTQPSITEYSIIITSSPVEGGTVTGDGNYQLGQTCTVTASANNNYTFTNWTENDEVVSTEAVYIFTVDSDRTLVANFTYNSGGSDHDYVDLGLPSGTLWATCNVGADSPEAYGDYFAWGEIQFKDVYDWITYQYCNGSVTSLTKYCNNSIYGYNGFTDDLTILEPIDDAVTANWGDSWRMPTKEEWQELLANTTHAWTTQNGVKGRLFIALNGNSLFLPAAGFRSGNDLCSTGNVGTYWSSSLKTDGPGSAWDIFFQSGSCSVHTQGRGYGQSVRAVHLDQQGITYSITISANPSNGGTVSGGGTYQQGQSCTVSATAATGYTFTNWTENGSVVSTNANYTFTVNSNRTLVAHFSAQAPNTYTISVSSDPTNGGSVTGGGTYQQGQSCTVSATAATGYIFTYWTENGSVVSTNANYTFTVSSNRTLVAHFSAQAPNTYTISVSSNPSNGGSVTGGGTYQQGQSCTVSATANSGYTFLRWTENGSQVSTNANYTFIVTGNRTLIAQFQSQSYNINVSANPTNGGTVSGGGAYQQGQSCTVSATAAVGYTFTNWTENGSQVSTNANYTFTVTSNRTLVANFTVVQNPPTGAINGLFTINANGDQVFFSQGNLQYQPSTGIWRFAENQYDVIITPDDMTNFSSYYNAYYAPVSSQYTSTYSGWIDLFGWGTSGYNHGAVCYQPWSTNTDADHYYAYGHWYWHLYDRSGKADWGYNAILNGGNEENSGWRTLTGGSDGEWYYILNTRNTSSGIRYANAQVAGMNGVILLPDNWSTSVYSLCNTNTYGASFSSNVISAIQWTTLENAGAVFLPAAGLRYHTMVFSVGGGGAYWSATAYGGNSNYANLYIIHTQGSGYNYRYKGFSVRLVRDY